MSKFNCPVCKLFINYKWDIYQIDKFNKFLQDEYTTGFTDYQIEQIKFEFNILLEDISTISSYQILRHRKECIIDENLAITIGEHEPEDFLTRKDARELISNFRELDYRDKKSVVVQNWLEVIMLLTAATKKNINRNLRYKPNELMKDRDIRISKLIIETFKLPTFGIEDELKIVSDNRLTDADKFKGKLKDIKEMLTKD